MASVTYDHVTKTFGDTAAVKDLLLEVSDGEFMVLVGPSGLRQEHRAAHACRPGAECPTAAS